MSSQEDYGYEDEQGEHGNMKLLREILEVAILTLLFFGIVRVLVQNYRVDGPSMQPTLYTSEYILVDKAEYYLHSPERGDVVVFVYPDDPSKNFVKRIVGVPGDTVEVMANGDVVVDGVTIREPYIKNRTNPYQPEQVKLRDDQYFVLGDNRGDSLDSRAFGPVPRKDIIGKAALVYWPLSNLHLLPDGTSTFANLPSPKQ